MVEFMWINIAALGSNCDVFLHATLYEIGKQSLETVSGESAPARPPPPCTC